MSSAVPVLASGREPRKLSVYSVLNTISGTVLLFFVVFGLLGSAWRLGINPKEYSCLPWRFYLVRNAVPDSLERGLIYRYQSHGTRGIPDGIRIGKYLAALPGDHVHVDASGIFINGQRWGALNPDVMEKMGLDYNGVRRDYIVPVHKVLMLGTLERSFDGRYWGVIDQSQIDGRVYPLW